MKEKQQPIQLITQVIKQVFPADDHGSQQESRHWSMVAERKHAKR